MHISTDDFIIFRRGIFKLNYTILFSGAVTLLLAMLAVILSCEIERESPNNRNVSLLQAAAEVFFEQLVRQIREISRVKAEIVLPFVGTIFLYVIASNLITIVPLFSSATASLTTTVALALVVAIFAIFIGLRERGLGYLRKYVKPIFIMVPFNIMGDLSKLASLSIRLYGNVMSSFVIDSILANIPLLSTGFPVIISLLGMIGGVIQAYIFSVLSLMFLSPDD
ncbi:MAG: F0F1 ATP synthase subunit A [Rickettsiales bacterium]|jgi:F-type H+-transporting ATPase subunit a|nr:F0F1 ATP synthase subunit A [Rickettsiales bacterium]